ncbi:helix-turn-helix domain-containing protein [Clostridium sp. Marseille-P2415]|uniref:helix-turn-helix domain-containing protein n=1 Tax=Clostridium sp. Marseille-P2415 TaxID=1805471 RepID=UPI001F48FF7C|nr:helix-turn-helix transcriptional regulator [Clostridium sp. Marseille-P2415]
MGAINERIGLVLKELNLTKTEVAKKLKVSQQYISKLVVTGKPSDRLVDDICEKFNISEEWLRTGEGEMFKQLTEQQKVMKYTAMLLKDTDSVIADAIKNFITTYEQLDDASKKVLNEIALKYMANLKKDQ